ncbi:hypothetical protein C0W96_02085 [Photobacterium kishitanii]|nr:hypothetical protein UB40_05060 [Photobacterium kishitanii]PSV08065.1 hypothetical protein C0W96_02085 [Photobacterium kishitanii]PSV75451.1 hypothetical protein C0W29_11315 [Photobacterium kishitanii]
MIKSTALFVCSLFLFLGSFIQFFYFIETIDSLTETIKYNPKDLIGIVPSICTGYIASVLLKAANK